MSKVQITFAFDSVSEAVSFMSKTDQGRVLLGAEKLPTIEVAKPDPKPPKPAKLAAAPAQAAASDTPSAATDQTAAQGGEVEYKTLQAAVFKLVGMGDEAKAAAVAIAASFGVPSFKALPENRRGEALALVEAKLAELSVA